MKKIITDRRPETAQLIGIAGDDHQMMIVKYLGPANSLVLRHVIAGRMFEQYDVSLPYLRGLCRAAEHPSFAALDQLLEKFEDLIKPLYTPIPFHVITFDNDWEQPLPEVLAS